MREPDGAAAESISMAGRISADKQLATLTPEVAARLLVATEDGVLHDEIIARLPADALIPLIERVTYPPLRDKLVRHAVREL